MLYCKNRSQESLARSAGKDGSQGALAKTARKNDGGNSVAEAMSLEGKTMLIGVGAQKAGTTWLHAYLAARPDVFMSPIKELHYFNSCHDADPNNLTNRKFEDRFREILGRGRLIYPRGVHERRFDLASALFDRLRMAVDSREYIGFFRRRVGPAHRVFGEITPAYSLLTESALAAMRAQWPDLRIVFLMRDPVARFFSALGMGEGKDPAPLAERVERALREPVHLPRGMYHETILRLRRVFPESALHCEFYEHLFAEDAIRRLCAFLGLPFQPAPYAARINAARAAERPSDALIARVRDAHAPVYQFCRAEFGDRVPSSWHSG